MVAAEHHCPPIPPPQSPTLPALKKPLVVGLLGLLILYPWTSQPSLHLSLNHSSNVTTLLFLCKKSLMNIMNILVFENCCSVAQMCPTLCSPMNCGAPGLPVIHYLPEFTQTHVH